MRDFECVVVSDGTFTYPQPSKLFFVNAPEERLAHALRRRDIDPGRWEHHVTVYLCLVIDTGEHQVLVDTGAGDTAPTTGKLIPNLRREGVSPEDVDTVILTHGHPDHIGGNIDTRGRPAFPNARYIMHKEEWDFWASEPDLMELRIDDHIRGILLKAARDNLPPIQDRLVLVDHEREVVPGIRVVSAAGHTPGHIALIVSSHDEQLLVISDAFLHPIHIERPEWCAAVDLSPDEAMAARRRLLDLASSQRTLVHAFHFPLPGLGRVVHSEGRWQWRPI